MSSTNAALQAAGHPVGPRVIAGQRQASLPGMRDEQRLTAFPESREEWLLWRRSGIGGSDAAAICGLDPFRSATSVWLEKVGLDDGAGPEDEAQRWGRLLEPAVIAEFEVRTELFVGDRQKALVHPTIPYLRATLDGCVYESVSEDVAPLGIFEGKTASRRAWDWADGVPDRVAIQVQHNLAVTGLDQAWVAALLFWPIPRLVIHEVPRDDRAIAELLEIETDFWRRVQERRLPAIDGSEATAEALRRAYRVSADEKAVELSEEAAGLLRERETAREEEKAAAARRQAAENALMAMLGDAEAGLINGYEVVTWKRFSTARIDLDALRLRHPKLAKRFMKTSVSRRLLIKPYEGEED